MKNRPDPMLRLDAARLLGMPMSTGIVVLAQRICKMRNIPMVQRTSTAQRVVRQWLKNPVITVPAEERDVFLEILDRNKK